MTTGQGQGSQSVGHPSSVDPTILLHARIENDFSFHPATPETGPKHDQVRASCRMLAHQLVDVCPPSRELSLSLTALDETMHWANAAIAKAGGVA